MSHLRFQNTTTRNSKDCSVSTTSDGRIQIDVRLDRRLHYVVKALSELPNASAFSSGDIRDLLNKRFTSANYSARDIRTALNKLRSIGAVKYQDGCWTLLKSGRKTLENSDITQHLHGKKIEK